MPPFLLISLSFFTALRVAPSHQVMNQYYVDYVSQILVFPHNRRSPLSLLLRMPPSPPGKADFHDIYVDWMAHLIFT